VSLSAYREACDDYASAEARVKRAADARALAVWAMARDGLSLRDIADLLGCTRQNAHKLICRARDIGDVVVVADVPTVAPSLSSEHLAAARAILPALRARVRAEASAARTDSLRILQNADAMSVTRPSDRAIGEWDWTRGLMPAELERLGNWWSSSPANHVDAVADRLRAALPAMSGLGADEVMGRIWLYHTRIVDAAGAVARGKLPVAKRYSSSINVANLAPGVVADGYSPVALLGDDESAARHVASVDAVREADEAYRMLGDSVGSQYGPTPWTMSAESYTAELLSIAAQLEGTDEMTSSELELRARHDELVPKLLDDGADWPTLHASIVACAISAGLA
jgi:hypothetical protein